MERSGAGVPSAATSAKIILSVLVFFLACRKPTRGIVKAIGGPAKITVMATEVKVHKKKIRRKKLYLTFDDGPNRGSSNVLDIITDENVPVSFFIVGEHVFASRLQAETWDSLKSNVHIDLCNHSYSHAHNAYAKYYQSPDSVVKDFERTRDSLHLTNAICRTPGRNIWRIDSLKYTDLASSAAAADSLQKAGFVLMGWDLEWHFDPKTMSVTSTADKLLEDIDSMFSRKNMKQTDHLVVLAHDQVYKKADDSIQLRQLLQKIKLRDEYELSLVTEYPGASKN